jgi:hypothetical protein
MRKDHDLKSTDWADHSRNSGRGKAGVNRAKRHRVKQNLSENNDVVAKPAKKKYKKRFGIKSGDFCRWYKTKRARDQAWDDLDKSEKSFLQVYGKHLPNWVSRNSEKVER